MCLILYQLFDACLQFLTISFVPSLLQKHTFIQLKADWKIAINLDRFVIHIRDLKIFEMVSSDYEMNHMRAKESFTTIFNHIERRTLLIIQQIHSKFLQKISIDKSLTLSSFSCIHYVRYILSCGFVDCRTQSLNDQHVARPLFIILLLIGY